MKKLIFTIFLALNASIAQADTVFDGVLDSPSKSFYIGNLVKNGLDKNQIFIVDVKAKKAIAAINPSRDMVIDWYRWANDDRVLYQLSYKTDKAGHVNGLTVLMSMDRDGKNRKQIYGAGLESRKRDTRINVRREIKAYVEMVDSLPKDKKNVLIAEYPLKRTGLAKYEVSRDRSVQISKINVYSGKRKKVKTVSFGEAKSMVYGKSKAKT